MTRGILTLAFFLGFEAVPCLRASTGVVEIAVLTNE